VDTVEYEDGKAFVVSSFVSEDAAESGGSASLILKKMAVLNPCIDDGTRVKCAACTASPIRERWRLTIGDGTACVPQVFMNKVPLIHQGAVIAAR
jgi:hypothetical protein